MIHYNYIELLFLDCPVQDFRKHNCSMSKPKLETIPLWVTTVRIFPHNSSRYGIPNQIVVEGPANNQMEVKAWIGTQ